MSHKTEKEPNLVIRQDHLHHTARQKVAHHTRLLSNMTQTAPFIVPLFSYGSISLDKSRKLKQNRTVLSHRHFLYVLEHP